MTGPQGGGCTGMRTPAGQQDWIPGHGSPLGGGTEGSTEGGGSCLCWEQWSQPPHHSQRDRAPWPLP